MNITKQMQNELLHILKMKKILGLEHIDPIHFTAHKKEHHCLPNDQKSLDEYITNCSLCELHKRKEGSFLGKGDPLSSVYIVGLDYKFWLEKEFMLIKNMCEKVLGQDINEIYMTNIIKCSTQENKTYAKRDIQECLPYVKQQITLAQPKVIITLGDVFGYFIKSDEALGDITGNKYYYKNSSLFAVMDPLYIYKNPSQKEKMFKDLQKIKTIMDNK